MKKISFFFTHPPLQMKILDLPLASILWLLNQYETGIHVHGILKSPFCIKVESKLHTGFMQYGWNKNNHKVLCIPFIRQGLRNYSLELRTTHYAYFIFLGLDDGCLWNERRFPFQNLSSGHIPLPHVRTYMGWQNLKYSVDCRQI